MSKKTREVKRAKAIKKTKEYKRNPTTGGNTMKMKVSEIRLDPDLLAMRPINAIFVSRYRQAYRQGADFPPPFVDQKDNCVSGAHRVTAMLQEFGEDHEIDVVKKRFKTNKERLEFFAKENTKHGNPLDGFSKKKISLALIKEGATEEDVARIFDVSVKRVIHWGDNNVMVEIGNGKTEARPAKRGLDVKKPITEKQYQEHIVKDRGVPKSAPITSLTGQLIRWIKNGFVPKSEVNIDLLAELRDEIDAWLGREEAKAA